MPHMKWIMDRAKIETIIDFDVDIRQGIITVSLKTIAFLFDSIPPQFKQNSLNTP